MEFRSLFKLSALSLLIAAPVTTVLAQEVYTPCSFCGFTLGLGVGATTMMSNVSGDTDVGSSGVIIPGDPPVLTATNAAVTSADAKIYKYGPMARLFAGYGLVFENHGYIGGELGANFLGASNTDLTRGTTSTSSSTEFIAPFLIVTNTNKNLSTRTKVTRNSVEPFLDLKLGFLSTPTVLVYLRGGINYNTIKVKQTADFSTSGTVDVADLTPGLQPTSSSGSAAFSASHSNDKSGIGYRAGVGLEYMVTPNMGVSADYVYSFYPKVKSTATQEVTDLVCEGTVGCSTLPGTFTSTAKANVNDQQVLAQLIYHFGV